jgi:hypothetical protein
MGRADSISRYSVIAVSLPSIGAQLDVRGNWMLRFFSWPDNLILRRDSHQQQDFLEHLPRYRHLSHLERDVVVITADLDQLFPQAGGQSPRSA